MWFVSLSLGATRRMIYLGRAPASLPPRVPLMLISSLRNCTKARHVWSVNFCHHKSIGHARGGGSFRRIGGREIGPRPSCCEIQTISNSEELGTCIKNLPTIHILKIDSESTNLFYLYPGREIPSFLSERAPVVVFIKSAAPPTRRLLHQSFRLIGPRNLPLSTKNRPNRRIYVPRKRPPKKKKKGKKRAHKRPPPRPRGRGAFFGRAPVVESLLIARINPSVSTYASTTIEIEKGKRSFHTRMLKLYRSRSHSPRFPDRLVPRPSYKFSNINHDSLSLNPPPPPPPPPCCCRCRSNPGRDAGHRHCSKIIYDLLKKKGRKESSIGSRISK